MKELRSYLIEHGDGITTVAGLLISFIVAANVDYGKAMHGDATEQGKLIGAALLALKSWLTNKPSKPTPQ